MCPLRKLAFAIVSFTMIGCGHGPPERTVSIGDYDSPNGAEVTIALREFDVSRRPRGLSAFPGGGFPITLDRGVEINACRKGDGGFRQIAVMHEQVDSAARFDTPLIVAWLDTAVRIQGTTRKEMVVRLPADIHVGTLPKPLLQKRVLPECASALAELRRSSRMPDATPSTPP